ncbi:unnamed protein product [Symbiodinium microadriaticum]|nr:unnamed protein product [Symbiodinium microadriaticum]
MARAQLAFRFTFLDVTDGPMDSDRTRAGSLPPMRSATQEVLVQDVWAQRHLRTLRQGQHATVMGPTAPSRGSVGHPTLCNRPCIFIARQRHCQKGLACGSCHHKHNDPKLDKKQRHLMSTMPREELLGLLADLLRERAEQDGIRDVSFVVAVLQRKNFSSIVSMAADRCQGRSKAVMLQESAPEVPKPPKLEKGTSNPEDFQLVTAEIRTWFAWPLHIFGGSGLDRQVQKFKSGELATYARAAVAEGGCSISFRAYSISTGVFAKFSLCGIHNPYLAAFQCNHGSVDYSEDSDAIPQGSSSAVAATCQCLRIDRASDVLVPASEASEFREAWLQEAAEPYQEWMSPWGVQLDLATTIAFAVQSPQCSRFPRLCDLMYTLLTQLCCFVDRWDSRMDLIAFLAPVKAAALYSARETFSDECQVTAALLALKVKMDIVFPECCGTAAESSCCGGSTDSGFPLSQTSVDHEAGIQFHVTFQHKRSDSRRPVVHVARAILESTVNRSEILSARMQISTELNSACHQQLLDTDLWCQNTASSLGPCSCLFGDVLSWNVGTQYTSLCRLSYPAKKRKIYDADTLPTMHCWAHNQQCVVPLRVHLGVSGLPCTDMSRAGKMLKSAGPTASVYLTHAKYCQNARVPLPVLECTPALDMDMVEECHGENYDWYQLMLGPEDTGHSGVSRPRTYVIGNRRESSQCLHDPFELCDRVTSQLRWDETQVSDYLVATDHEIVLEAQALCRQRGIRYRELADLSYLLTKAEARRLDFYEAEFRIRFKTDPGDDPNLVVFLGDNPEYSLNWSAVSGKVPCFRMNSRSGLYWLPKYRRFLTSKEKLAIMGWPVHHRLADAMGVATVPSIDIGRAAGLAGNAMHVHCVGLAQLIALSNAAAERSCSSITGSRLGKLARRPSFDKMVDKICFKFENGESFLPDERSQQMVLREASESDPEEEDGSEDKPPSKRRKVGTKRPKSRAKTPSENKSKSQPKKPYGQTLKFRNWGSTPVQHKMYFMAAVAPDKASESYLRTLKISQVQTAFYAFFRQTNSSRLEGGCSGSGQRNLSGMSLQHVGVLLQFIRVLRKMNSCLPRPKKEGILAFLQEQYKANGEPARNRHVLELVRDMEIELSRSIRFEVKEIGGKQYLTEGNTSRWLPEKPPGKWLAEILHDKSSGVPFVKHSNGEVAPCISFFQNGEDYQSRPRSLAETLSNPDLVSSSSTGPPPPVPSPYVQPLQRQLLPGMEVPGGPPELAPLPGAKDQQKQGVPGGVPAPPTPSSEAEAEDDLSVVLEDFEPQTLGDYVLCAIGGKVAVHTKDDEKNFRLLPGDCKDWRLFLHEASGKIYAASPSGQACVKAVWVAKILKGEATPDDLALQKKLQERADKIAEQKLQEEAHAKRQAEAERLQLEQEAARKRQEEERLRQQIRQQLENEMKEKLILEEKQRLREQMETEKEKMQQEMYAKLRAEMEARDKRHSRDAEQEPQGTSPNAKDDAATEATEESRPADIPDESRPNVPDPDLNSFLSGSPPPAESPGHPGAHDASILEPGASGPSTSQPPTVPGFAEGTNTTGPENPMEAKPPSKPSEPRDKKRPDAKAEAKAGKQAARAAKLPK